MKNNNKIILGLDLGTNSIGWALIERDAVNQTGKIIQAGSRIIPMSQDILDKFGSGASISQTAERTGFRSTRRLRERHLLRRERLHRVLNNLGYLPHHYASQIDFEKRLGKFIPETETKLAYIMNNETGKADFLFKKSFEEMLDDFKKFQPQLLLEGKKVPYDWTIYYLRKKALREKIEKEELAWLLLHFNQKRGYYQLRGEEEEENTDKLVEFHALKVVEVTSDEPQQGKSDIWYNVILENGWIYRRSSKTPLFDWKGKTQEFIVTTELNPDKSVKTDKEGKEKRSFKAVDSEKDWVAIKKSTEEKIEKSSKTVGEYIYDTLLKNPNQKVKGKLVRTIERKFYKDELKRILEKQQQLHTELKDKQLYKACLEELYQHNESHRTSITEKDFVHLFLNDILFYQRPLKSKKSLIGNCKFESKIYIKDGKKETVPLKGIPKSHPLFQELRIWKFIQNVRIYQKEKEVHGKLETDVDVTTDFLKTKEDYCSLFEWLNARKEIDQKAFLKYPAFNLKKNIDLFRWNYVEDKTYPGNETRSLITTKLDKVKNIPENFLTPGIEEALWHILYSVEDKNDLEKAFKTFSTKYSLSEDFVVHFKKFPPFKKEYGAYSAKALKKLLPLIRMGKYWNQDAIHPHTKERIEKILTGEYDENIKNLVRERSLNFSQIEHFQGLPEWLASYIVYDRHAENEDSKKWKTANDIELLEQHSLRNPIVEQVINETLQVVRDIWKQYGNSKEDFFDEIHIELGREMKNTKADREKITRQVTENENTNLRIKALLIEMLNDTTYENVRPYSPMQHEILKIYEEGVLSGENGHVPDDILKISKMAQPTTSELIRYKLWLEQKYRSPYTGHMIPLNKLFTPAYEIEHIIPQTRYFDDSFSNKVICESAVNKLKDNCTGFEFIQKEGGRIVELGFGETVKIFTKEGYEKFVKEQYVKSRSKMKRLLMEEIPEAFIQRQLNDSRYISRVVKSLLSNIVREENELEATSKNVIACNGNITSVLKHDWGLNDVWNELITPRFERLNKITNSANFGEWTNKEGKKVFQTQVPLQLQKGFNRKRIDHRHHALDAIVIACTSRDQINYLNNESTLGKRSREEKEKKRYDLRHKLCFKKYNDTRQQNYKWSFYKPWETITQDVQEILETIVVSFKQNKRVINKTVNFYQKWVQEDGILVKKLIKQHNGDNWAIRKSMHKDTVSGLVKLQFKKAVSLPSALDNWQMIVDKSLKTHIKKLALQGYDKKKLTAYFKEKNYQFDNRDISKTDIYYWDLDDTGNGKNAASRVKVNEGFNSSMIHFVTDSGIQNILLRHLEKYNEEINGKIIEHPELAFCPEGLDELNKNIVLLNNGQPHQPIYKLRTYEPKGNKFNIGQAGNKKDKYVEAAKGTNLFFAIYKDENGKRSYETIPLNIVIERQKQQLLSVPETNEAGHKLLMHLSPNDLVYIPNEEEQENKNFININKPTKDQLKRIYKIVSFTGNRLYAIPYYVAASIVDKAEFSQLNKMEYSLEKTSIKDLCIKLKTDRLGNITCENVWK
jgi:CRISPR-associated endonuclease Csn1